MKIKFLNVFVIVYTFLMNQESSSFESVPVSSVVSNFLLPLRLGTFPIC